VKTVGEGGGGQKICGQGATERNGLVKKTVELSRGVEKKRKVRFEIIMGKTGEGLTHELHKAEGGYPPPAGYEACAWQWGDNDEPMQSDRPTLGKSRGLGRKGGTEGGGTTSVVRPERYFANKRL